MISVTLKGDLKSVLLQGYKMQITNKAKYAKWVEYGTKSPIFGRPIMTVAVSNKSALGAKAKAKARQNGTKYPGILAQVRKDHPTAMGFLFIKQVRGQKAQRIISRAWAKFEFPKTSQNLQKAVELGCKRLEKILGQETPPRFFEMKKGWKVTYVQRTP